MSELNFPTEIIELPSKGKIYPSTHPLRSGKVEMKYMTAKEEDILTNQNLIENGTVLDKLLGALTLGKFDISDMSLGDKNAIFMGARILGYGSEYRFTHGEKEHVVDLSLLEPKPFDTDLCDEEGHIPFTFPKSENKITFKILTEKEEKNVTSEIESFKKVNSIGGGEVTTRLKHQIVSLNGDTNKETIRSFVETSLLAQDSRALRTYIKEISPDIDLNYTLEDNNIISIPINIGFFWPDL